MMQYCHALRRLRLIGKTRLSVLLICCLTGVACSESKSGSADDVTHPGAKAPGLSESKSSSGYDVTLRHLDQIPPGTIISKEAPKGWSNLIIKSYSRPGSGDMDQLSSTADRLSRLLFTAILADVKADKTGGGQRYTLAKVAVGLGVCIGDKDTVVTPDAHQRLGAGLSILARVVLRTAQEKRGEIVVVARSNTLMIFDSPSLMLLDGKHKPIVLRYAVLVEENTGRLNTLVWALARAEGGTYSGPVGAIQWLPPNLTGDCILHVDGGEFILGQPTEKAFAMTAPPEGRKQIETSDDLKLLAARPHFSATTAAELESKLRQALQQAAE